MAPKNPSKPPQPAPQSLWAGTIDFILHHKKWWITPIVVIFILICILLFFGGSGVSPFIYSANK